LLVEHDSYRNVMVSHTLQAKKLVKAPTQNAHKSQCGLMSWYTDLKNANYRPDEADFAPDEG
jgi:hypothetical protein